MGNHFKNRTTESKTASALPKRIFPFTVERFERFDITNPHHFTEIRQHFEEWGFVVIAAVANVQEVCGITY
jgi:hypothetical protein